MKQNDRQYPAYLMHDSAIPSPAGNRYKPKYMIITNESSLRLQKTCDIDIQAEIDSYEDSCCLQSMISKAARSNDMSFLIRKQGVYADVSGMPDDLRSLINSSRGIVNALKSVDSASGAADPAPGAADPAPGAADPAPGAADPAPAAV